MTVNGNINRLLPTLAESRTNTKVMSHANHLLSLAEQPLLFENDIKCTSRTVSTDTQWASLVSDSIIIVFPDLATDTDLDIRLSR